MYRPHILFRIQLAVLAATGVLTVVFFLLYYPLSRREALLNTDIKGAWQRLATLNIGFRGTLGMDLETTRANRRLAEKSLTALRQAANQASERIALAQEWKDRAHQPFNLLEYNIKRQQLIQELQQMAQAGQVALDPAVGNGAFPEYQPNQSDTAQLWAQMHVVDQILLVAVANKVKSIKSATLLPTLNTPGSEEGREPLDEFRLRIELTGSASALLNFMRSLPLRPGELATLGLPASSEAKPALFLRRFVLKRDLADPNDAIVDAIVSGLATREGETKP
jgi:hypothetical protein